MVDKLQICHLLHTFLSVAMVAINLPSGENVIPEGAALHWNTHNTAPQNNNTHRYDHTTAKHLQRNLLKQTLLGQSSLKPLLRQIPLRQSSA